jgi:hypothetical protein
MAVQDELKRLLARASVTPYRRIGKIRIVHDPRTPADTLAACVEAVRAFAATLADTWAEPSGKQAAQWHSAGLRPLYICDDPCPRGIDPMACNVAWLIARCERYHFRLTSPEPGKLLGVAHDGWRMGAIKPLLPVWFADAGRERMSELADALARQEATA